MSMSIIIKHSLLSATLGLILSACGGSQSAEEEPAVVDEQPSCISERWARPPEQIGENPPEAFPSGEAIEPFRSTRARTGNPSNPQSEPTSAADGSEQNAPETSGSQQTESDPSSSAEPASTTPESGQ